MHQKNIAYIIRDSSVNVIITDKKYMNKIELFCISKDINIIYIVKNKLNIINFKYYN